MLWGFLIILLGGGVFAASILLDDIDIATIFAQMGLGGAIGVFVGMAVFVYVSGLVYGMSTPNGRKALLGIGVFTILLGLAFLMYYPELNAVLTFLPSSEDVEPMPFVGLPIIATGGLMCKLGSLKD
jgi:hypothetical protein|tara:strand:- start:1558 stop:1938 length:381 start_codon:yes stop_codon:yes gene_type:complete